MGLLPEPAALAACLRDDAVWRPAIDVIAQRHRLGSDWGRPADGSNVVFLGDDVVIKLFSPTWGEEARIEAASLAACSGRLPVAVPEVVATGELEGWPYLVMSRLVGRSLGAIWPTVDGKVGADLLRQTGQLLAAIHDVPPPPGLPNAWRQFELPIADVVTKHERDKAPAAWVAEIETLLRDPTALCGPSVLVHGDVHPAHLLVDADLRLCGLFDFADCMVGPAVYDVGATSCLMAVHVDGGAETFYRAYGTVERSQLRPALLRQRYCALRIAIAAIPEARRPASIEGLLALMGSSTAGREGA